MTNQGRRGQTDSNPPTDDAPPRAAKNKPFALNLGCGHDIRHDWGIYRWMNVDKYPAPGIMTVDIDRGLPFPDRHFDLVLASHILEHVDDFDHAMREIWRVLKPAGYLDVRVPCGFNGYPYHKRFFTRHGVKMMDTTNGMGQSLETIPFKLVGRITVQTGAFPWWHVARHLRIHLPTVPWDERRELVFRLEKWIHE